MTKITIEELMKIVETGETWIIKDPKNTNTKLYYALKKKNEKNFTKVLEPIRILQEELQEKMQEAAIKHAYTNKEGILEYDIVKNENGQEVQRFKYGKEALIKKNKEVKQLVKEYSEKIEKAMQEEINTDLYLATELPANLTEEEREIFSKFVTKTTLRVESRL